MNWNDWEAVWRRQEPPRGATADLAALRSTFEAKHRQLRRTVAARDWLEASAGIVVTGAMGLIWWQQGPRGWPLALSIALTLGVTGVFLRERARARSREPEPGSPLLTKLEADLAELRHQRRLFTGIWRWYLGPLAAAIAIGFATLVYNSPTWSPQRDPLFIVAMAAFFAGCMIAVWFVNRSAVRRQIDPRIEELEKLHRALLSGE